MSTEDRFAQRKLLESEALEGTSSEEGLKRLLNSTEVCLLPVPPDIGSDRDGESLALVLSDLLKKGAGLGKYGGRMLIHFDRKPIREVWEDKDVVETCRKALETDPGILDALVWEDHPELEFEVPDETERSILPGRLWFVSLLEPGIWERHETWGYLRDPDKSREELGKWNRLAAKSRS